MRLGLGLGLSRGAGAGGPLNLVAPAVTGNLTNGSTLTSTTGTWTGLPSYTYQWKRDGVDISGQTASTYTYSVANDDGRYISVNVTATNDLGSNAATSNAVITGESSVFYETSFVGTNGTSIVGFESWAGVGFNANLRAQIQSNEFAAVSSVNGMQYTRVTSTADHEIEATASYVAAGATGVNTQRRLFARFTDANNYVVLDWSNGGWTLVRRVAGANTTLQSGGTGNLVSGDVLKLRASGNYAKVYRNGVEAAQSAAASGGLGYDISAVPSIAKIALGAGDGTPLSYPYALFTDAQINNILADEIVISTIAAENIDDTLGRIQIRLTGTIAGSVTQLQALVLSPTGRILLDWADVSGISGSTFNSVTAELPASAQGASPIVWLRDKTNKKTASSSVVAVPVQPTVQAMIMGVNENSTGNNELGPFLVWINNGDYNAVIAARGAVPSASGIAASADGSGSTVARGWDGSIGVNGLGITTYGLVYNDTSLPASATGNYTITFPAGTTVTPQVTPTNWTYSSVTGIGTYDWPSPGNVTLDLRVNVATLTAGGLATVSLKKTGAPAVNTQAATNAALLASTLRALDVLAINNDDIYPDRTSLAHPSRTAAQREQRAGRKREDYVAHLNATGASLYFNVRLFDSDALIEEDANYYLQNLAAGRDIHISLSNEIWNFIFKQTVDVREAGVRAGFAPIGVTDPSLAIPETVYSANLPTVTVTGSGTTRNTTVAYTNGQKFIYNGFSGVQVYQAIGDQPIGAAFQATTNANFSVLYDNTATARAGDRWVATRMARIREIWDARAAVYGRARPYYWIEGQAAGGFASVSKYLDYNNFHLQVDGISAAHYWGGGVAAANPGDYTSSSTGFTTADKELLYTTANQTTAINTLKDKFFAIAQTTFIDPVGQNIKQWRLDIANYAVGKGLSKDRYRFGQYECNHHLVLSGWPDSASAWSAATAYVVGNLVKDGGKIFKCILGHTNQVTSNVTYWTEIASTTVTAENRRELFYASLLNDSRFGDLMTYYYGMLGKYAGDLCHHYTRIQAMNANGCWGVMSNEDDTANERFLALKDFKATL